jgi:hypothetical protein
MQDELLAAVVQICHEEEEPRWGGGGVSAWATDHSTRPIQRTPSVARRLFC